MSGLSIGIGVGLKYSTPINKIERAASPPEEDIENAFLLEGNYGVLFLDDGTYLELEVAAEGKINKSYWNF